MTDQNTPLSDEERAELEALRAEKARREEEERARKERAELEALRAEQAAADAPASQKPATISSTTPTAMMSFCAGGMGGTPSSSTSSLVMTIF